MVFIILSMIVKNESHILQRCINSCSSIIDGISICDTGSQDTTVNIIEENIKKFKGKCHQHEWRNFGHNRSLSFRACQETALELGYPLDQTYALLMDADMILKIKSEFKKNDLKSNGYSIIQKNPSITYYNTRLIKLSKPWKCIGVTHEYWGGDGCTSDKYEHLWIDDINDGGAKADKFERDVRLLTQGLIDEPKNERYMFYLAQSYKDNGEFDKAIEWYLKRIEAGGWQEEQWFAMFQIARIYRLKDNREKMIEWYHKAHEARPQRAEPIYELGRYFREKGLNQTAFLYSRQAMEIPYPVNDLLFIAHSVYEYDAKFDVSVSAYYTPSHRAFGFQITDQLLLQKGIPKHIKDTTQRNLLYYLKNLPVSRVIELSMTTPIIEDNPDKHYITMNPFLYYKNLKKYANMRCINYTQQKGNYQSLSADKKIRTRNYLVELDDQWTITKKCEIREVLERKRYSGQVLGLEDIRLFNFNDTWYFTCTSLEEKEGHRPTQCLGRLKYNHKDQTYDVVHYTQLQYEKSGEIEKNWLPFLHQGKPHIIYSSYPFTVLRPNLDTGVCQIVKSDVFIKDGKELDLSSFRGSAPPVPYGDGYLYVIHEVAFVNWRTYYHRFVKLNRNLEITEISAPFKFEREGVEFCISAMNIDNRYYFGVGIEDASAKVFEMQKSVIDNLF